MSALEQFFFLTLAEREFAFGSASNTDGKAKIAGFKSFSGKELDDVKDDVAGAVNMAGAAAPIMVQASIPFTVVTLQASDLASKESVLAAAQKVSGFAADDLRVTIVPAKKTLAACFSRKAISARTAELATLGIQNFKLFGRGAEVVSALYESSVSGKIDKPVLYVDMLASSARLLVVSSESVDDIGSANTGTDAILEQVMAALGLKFPGSAARLFYGDLYDFDEHAEKLVAALAENIKARLSASATAAPGYIYTSGFPASRVALLTGKLGAMLSLKQIPNIIPIEGDASVTPFFGGASIGLASLISTGASGAWAIDLASPEEDIAAALSKLSSAAAPALASAPTTIPVPVKEAAATAPAPVQAKPALLAEAENFAVAAPAPVKEAVAPAPAPVAPASASVSEAPAPAPKPVAPIPTPALVKEAAAPIPAPAPKPVAPAPAPAPVPVPAKETVATPPAPKPVAPAPAPAPKPSPAPVKQPEKPVETHPKAEVPRPAPAGSGNTPPTHVAPKPAQAAPVQPASQQAVKKVEQLPVKKPEPAPAKPVAKAPQPASKPAQPAPAPAKAVPTSPAAKPAAKSNNIVIIGGVAAAVVAIIVVALLVTGGKKTGPASEPAPAPVKETAAPVKETALAKPDAEKPAPAAPATNTQAQPAAPEAAPAAPVVEQPAPPPPPPPPTTGSLSIQTNPVDAEIYINGELKGASPIILDDIPVGKVTIEIRKANYKTFTKTMEIVGGELQSVNDVALVMECGNLSITTSPGGVPYTIKPTSEGAGIEDASLLQGRTPVDLSGLKPGEYTVVFQRPGWKPYEQNVEIKPAQASRASFDYKPGKIRVTSTPENAVVTINGKKAGVTPLDLDDVAEGVFDVTVNLDACEPESFKIDMPFGGSVSSDLKLLRLDRIITDTYQLDVLPSRAEGLSVTIPEVSGVTAGNVNVMVVIGPDGKVEFAKVVPAGGNSEAANKSIADQVRSWTFTPGSRKGFPMRVQTMITVNVTK